MSACPENQLQKWIVGFRLGSSLIIAGASVGALAFCDGRLIPGKVHAIGDPTIVRIVLKRQKANINQDVSLLGSVLSSELPGRSDSEKGDNFRAYLQPVAENLRLAKKHNAGRIRILSGRLRKVR